MVDDSLDDADQERREGSQRRLFTTEIPAASRLQEDHKLTIFPTSADDTTSIGNLDVLKFSNDGAYCFACRLENPKNSAICIRCKQPVYNQSGSVCTGLSGRTSAQVVVIPRNSKDIVIMNSMHQTDQSYMSLTNISQQKHPAGAEEDEKLRQSQYGLKTVKSESLLHSIYEEDLSVGDQGSFLIQLEPTRCQIQSCKSHRKIVGICTKGFCASGACQRPFCVDHDGKREIINMKYAGKVCIECADKVNSCRKVCLWITFIIVFLLCMSLIGVLPLLI